MKRVLRVMLAGGALLLVGWPTHVAAIATHPFTELGPTSCVSATFCEAVGVGPNNAGFYVPIAEVWNGKSWLPQPVPTPSGSGFQSLNGVSCVSATFCEAVGGGLAEVWNGTTWAIQPTPNGSGLIGVSCLSVTFCEAVGGYTNTAGFVLPQAEVWDGTSWTLQSAPSPSGFAYSQLNGVSCVSATFCEAVGQANGPNGSALAEVWDGTSWTQQAIPNPPGVASGGSVKMHSVSCASASACEAVGEAQGVVGSLVEAWNGTSWALQASPTTAGFSGVSCVSANDCEAVGSGANSGVAAALWDGTSWTLQPTTTPSSFRSGATLGGVSCVSAVVCEASGSGRHNSARVLPLTEGWNGTVWTPQ